MNLRRSLRALAPASLRVGWALLCLSGEAKRILRGGDPPETRPVDPPRPYDHRLTRRLRRAARHLAPCFGRGDGLATATVAAWLSLRTTGWPCTLDVGRVKGHAAACLRLWGEPILGTAPPALVPERRCEMGPPILQTAPRLAPPSDGRVTRVPCSGTLRDDLCRLLAEHAPVVERGESVLLKPNFNSYHAPPASTALDLLSAVVGLLREVGAGRIAVGECCGNPLAPTRWVVVRAGLADWARDESVELILFDEEPWCQCPIPGRHFHRLLVPEALQRFDRLIYLASAKTHRTAGVSLSVKLGVGLMHPVQRIALHAAALGERIAEIPLAVQPDLAIVDARVCFITGGPEAGEVRAPGLLLAGRELTSLDGAALAVLRENGASIACTAGA